MNELKCPLCGSQMVAMDGNIMHPNDAAYGVTVWCPANYPAVCSAQEVSGHGKNLKEAMEVVTQKFTSKKGSE